MKKLVLLAAVAAMGMSAYAQDVFIIGANVNGQSWVVGAADAKMEAKGDGVFEWTGETLGTGFKFNDGTWDNGTFAGTDIVANIGSNGDVLEVGEEYYYSADASSSDIAMSQDLLSNPVVTLNLNEGWVKVTGNAEEVEYSYYLPGSYNSNEWTLNDECMFTKEGDKYVIKDLSFEKEGEFKFASDNWTKSYGCPTTEVEEGSEEVAGPSITISNDCLTANLTLGADNVATTLIGKFNVEATIDASGDTTTIIFSLADDTAVEGVEVENAPVYYYNLQGVRVENPVNGIYVKVVGEKAAKVLFNN